MGIYQEYIAKQLSPNGRDDERKKHLAQIGKLRDSAVLVYAARMSPMPIRLPIGVEYEDLLPFVDLLDGLSGDRVSVILETPGGSGEIGRQMVEILHDRFKHVTFIVPGTAKSTGTIMTLGGHEILMGPGSALGPIDAQLLQDGKTYSADALIEGLNRIKAEVQASGKLSPAYIPFLQKLSPGEIEHAHNALEFARVTVRDWLVKYKWANWTHHRTHSPGSPVTPEEKQARAYEISSALASQGRWGTHTAAPFALPTFADCASRSKTYSESRLGRCDPTLPRFASHDARREQRLQAVRDPDCNRGTPFQPAQCGLGANGHGGRRR